MYPCKHHKHHDQPVFFDDLSSGDRFAVSTDMLDRIGVDDAELVFVKLDPVRVVDVDGTAKDANCRAHSDNVFYVLSGDIRVFRVDEASL